MTIVSYDVWYSQLTEIRFKELQYEYKGDMQMAYSKYLGTLEDD